MTLIQMVEHGMVWQLVAMGALFVLMGIMLSNIGNGVTAKFAGEKENNPDSSTAAKTGDLSAVTAAITAAVNEYRKTNS